MKGFNFGWLLCLMVCWMACDNESPYKEKEWIKVEIAGEHAPVYAIYGNINNRLLVSLYSKILKTEDGGVTWTKKLDGEESFGRIEMANDTLFAISNFTDYYSLDDGENWQLLSRDLPLEYQGTLNTTNGITYRLQPNFEGELALPTFLLESKPYEKERNVFPYDHLIYAISLDDENGLYVGVVNTFVWNPESGFFEENFENNSAFYYAKN